MAIEWSKIYKTHKGKWVALKNDETSVIAVGNTLKEARAKAEKKKYSQAIFTRIPEDLQTYVG